jgi:hypothetical protein
VTTDATVHPWHVRALRRIPIILLKVSIGATILFLLLRKLNIKWSAIFDAARRLLMQPHWLIATLALLGLTLLCGAARWRTALLGLGVNLSRSHVGAIFLIGNFFNAFLPGTTGGDVARAVYVARDAPDHKPEALASIVIERLTGITVLLMMTLLGLLISGYPHQRTLLLLVVGVTMIAMFAALFALPPERTVKNWPLVSRIAAHPKIGPLAQRLYAAMRICRTHPALTLRLMAWSTLQHACAALSWLTIVCGLGVACAPLDFIMLVPAVLVAQMIPITPGALGVRESASVAFLHESGVPPEAAIVVSLASYAGTLVWSLAGGIALVSMHERRHRARH